MGQEFHLPDPDTQKLGYPTGYTVPNFGADHDIVNIKDAISSSEEKLDYKWTPTKKGQPSMGIMAWRKCRQLC